MIYRDKILSALSGCGDDFALYDADLRAQVAAYESVIATVPRMPRADVEAKLASTPAPGAIPSDEFYDHGSFIIPFERQFADREDASEWAYKKLLNVTTFAADGSQILPSKDFSIPLAAVQVGWFENPHTPGGSYVKDVAFEILSPEKVLVRTGGDVEASQQVVHQHRYNMELRALKNFISAVALRGFDASRPPVVFLDNLLVVSFVDILPPEQRAAYVNEILGLLQLSKEKSVPLVGYIDTSLSRDLINMLQTIEPDLQDSPKLQDSTLFTSGMRWGDRTPIFGCARQGILDAYGEDWRREIGFFYLKTSAEAPPSRVDLPLWIYERGLLDYVADVVCGEVIVGNGYPYIIEAADQTAVIGQEDRELFYALFQEYIGRRGLDLRRARKAVSKAQRR